METCTVEAGLLKKKPCGHASVTHCANCEQPLCSKHAVAQLKENGLRSGKFMCKDCDTARAEMAAITPPPEVKKPAPPAAATPPKEVPATQAPTQAATTPKPAADDALEFTPSTDKK